MIKKLLVALVMMVATVSCKTSAPLCEDTKHAADLAAAKVANVLNCKNPAAISASLMAQVEKAHLCQDKQQGVLGEVICRPVASYIAETVVKKLPAAWECEGGQAKTVTVNTLYSACLQGAVL